MENANGPEGATSDLSPFGASRLPPPGRSFPPPREPLSQHAAAVRTLSERLVALQRPLRLLDLLRWDDGVEAAFFAAGARELPRVDADYYRLRPPPFDPDSQRDALRALGRDTADLLGPDDPAAALLCRRCREYGEVVELLRRRGTPAFAELSGRLFGRAGDPCPPDGRSLLALSDRLATLFDGRPVPAGGDDEETLDAAGAVRALTERLGDYFGNSRSVRVRLSDSLSADASAGGECIKVRRDARFRPREVRILEVHEGWVHLGTTLAGQAQPVCTFLAKPSPSATVTQEGLAVLTELLSGASDRARVGRLADRVRAVAMAEGGADFLDVYRFFLARGLTPADAYQQGARVFRGSLPAGCGPFTKDLSYARGLVLLLDRLRAMTSAGRARDFALLFCGKTALEDLDALAALVGRGLVAPPRRLPPPFADLLAG